LLLPGPELLELPVLGSLVQQEGGQQAGELPSLLEACLAGSASDAQSVQGASAEARPSELQTQANKPDWSLGQSLQVEHLASGLEAEPAAALEEVPVVSAAADVALTAAAAALQVQGGCPGAASAAKAFHMRPGAAPEN